MARSSLGNDLGVHTNPRRYEKDNGFYSEVVTRIGAVFIPIWTADTDPARTDGLDTTVYHLHIENSTGSAITAWLEVDGVAVTPPYHVVDNDTVIIDWLAGLNLGDQDIDFNASVNDVVGQISGTEK